jgi:hypothetical protein
MASERSDIGTMSTAQLVGAIVDDTRNLVEKEIEAARLEFTEELGRLKRATMLVAVAVGAGVATTVGLTFMFVALLTTYTALSSWVAFAIAAAAFALVGVTAILLAKRDPQQIDLVPEKTLRAAQRDASWLQRRITES